MASIREKVSHQFQVQIRREGWPQQNNTFCIRKGVQVWAQKIKHKMDQDVFIDLSAPEAASLRDIIERYTTEQTAHRPSEQSRDVEDQGSRSADRTCGNRIIRCRINRQDGFQ